MNQLLATSGPVTLESTPPNKRHGLAYFIAITIALTLSQVLISPPHLAGDASTYWLLSNNIWDLSFPKTIRGYFFPLLLSPAREISNTLPSLGLMPLYILQTVIYALFFTFISPKLVSTIFNSPSKPLSTLIPPVLISFFFPGLITYPLSDLPALLLLLTAIHLVTLTEKTKPHPVRLIAYMAASGALAYGAYNTRTVYIFPVAGLLFATYFILHRVYDKKLRIMAVAAFCGGLTIAAIPQIAINIKHHDSPTPMVIANMQNKSLFANQLKWGITIQRYETMVSDINGEAKSVFHFYPSGEDFFKSHDLRNETASIKWYLKTVLIEPLTFAKIYWHHLLNGLDVRDGEVYIKSDSSDKTIRSALSMTIAFTGLALIALSITTRRVRASTLTLLLLISSPAIAIIPGAIETRFFLPFQFLFYVAIATHISEVRLNNYNKKQIAIFGLAYILFMATCFPVVQESVAHPLNRVPAEYIGNP